MEISIKIDWADLDLYGHVNNVAFYKYMQSARIAFCDSVGLSVLNEPNKLSFILAASECHYKHKLMFPGSITIVCKVVHIGNTSFHLEYKIVDQNANVAATGKDIIVLYDYNNDTKVHIPQDLKERLV